MMVFSFKNSKRNNLWSDEQKKEIVELNNQNIPISEIAKKYKGRDSRSIASLLNRMGWTANNRN